MKNNEIQQNDHQVKTVNLLREKTFNKELKNLVSRISDNEEDAPELPVEGVLSETHLSPVDNKLQKADSLTPAQLQRELHTLFYTIQNIDAASMESYYNPFDMQGTYHEHLHALLSRQGIDLYALCQYSLIDKVYRPFVNTIPSLNDENFVISIRGGIYKKLVNSAEGIIIEKEDIENDWTLSKEFSREHRYYAVLVKHAMYEAYRYLGPREISVKSFFPEMIFCMVLPDDFQDTQSILSYLRTVCAVPLAMLHEDVIENIDGQSSNEMLFNLVDYIAESAHRRGISEALMVEFNKTKPDMAPYMVKFFFSKIEGILSSASFAFRMDICETMILASKDELREVESIVKTMNEYDDYFSMEYILTSRPDAIYLKLID